MQKKIIALSVAAAIATPAWADNVNVTVYGVANVSFDLVDNGSAGATQGISTNKVSSNTSRIGFKGTEDLGDGLKALWQIEQTIAVDTGTWGASARNTYAGLSSASLGTVQLGLQDTPYKLSTRKLDVFGDSLGDNRSLLGGVAGTSAFASFDGRQSNSLAYLSPPLNGVTLAAAYVAGGESASASSNVKGSAWSLAGWYDAAPFYGSLAYEVHDLGTGATGTIAPAAAVAAGAYSHAGAKESAWKLGAGYKLDTFDLNFAYEKTSDSLGGTGAPTGVGSPGTVLGADVFGHSTYYLAGKYNLDSDAIKVSYSRAGNLAGATAGSDTSANQFSIGYDHGLSKRSTLYALYTRLNNGTNARYALSSASVATGTTAASAAGADPSAWSVGLKHVF